ncbi:MAG: shikimate kinase [Bacteroidetes bacterium MedPE-SWsnd-G1]|nr:MAG: shikimate kinase [Bacteroidetes bacterium MedPE-SWsnd-G1]
MKIVLIGYMASGKSAVGVELAKELNLKFIDLDNYIEQKEQKTIAEIFKDNGEIYFRKIESDCLNELLAEKNDVVLSLGGGTPCYGNNMDAIINNSKSIYLRTGIVTICSRLLNETNKRPLVSEISTEKLPEFIAKHLFERRFFYEKSNHVIDTDNKSIEELVEVVLKF